MADPVNHKYEWLIIFLVYNNNYYDPKDKQVHPRDKDKDYRTMRAQTKYILRQIRNSGFNYKVKTIFVEAQIKNTTDANGRTKIYATLSMLKKENSTWLPAEDEVWRRERNPDILTNAKSLEDILDRLKKNYSAKKHMIITAGHGSIVGINYYDPKMVLPDINKNLDFNEETLEGIRVVENRKVLDITPDEAKTLLYLGNEEINEVLEKVFPNKKLDILVMYNCIMQNIFTQYELRNKVDWLITPLSGIGIPGFNYISVLNEININPYISSAAVAEFYINSIRTGNGYSIFKEEIEQSWKLSATKLDGGILTRIQKEFDNVFGVINQLSEEDASIISHINEVIKHLFSYSIYCLKPTQIFDIGAFLASLLDNIKEDERFKVLSNAIIEFQKTLNEKPLTKIIFEGRSFYNVDPNINHYETRGSNFSKIANLALLFPIVKSDSDLLNRIYDESNYDPTNFKRYPIPSFLMSTSYAKVVNKIHKLPPMG